MQGELATKNIELAAAAMEAEKLLKDISENTTIAEVEKGKLAVMVDQVSVTAAVGLLAKIFSTFSMLAICSGYKLILPALCCLQRSCLPPQCLVHAKSMLL